MRRAGRSLGMAWLLAALAGCAGLSAPVTFNPAAYKRLVDEHRFDLAGDMLARIDPLQAGSEQSRLYRQYLDLAVQAYELETLHAASELESAGQWFEGEKLYRAARALLPRSAAIEGGYRDFDRHRSAYADDIRQALRLLRVRLLPAEIELTQQLVEVYPEDYALRNRLKQLEFEASELVALLRPLAQEAFAEGRYDDARNYDMLILQFGDAPVSRERVAAVDSMQSRAERQRAVSQQQQQRQQQQQQRANLWQEYDSAMSRSDYPRASDALRRLERQGQGGPRMSKERAKLDGLIRDRSLALIDEGKRSYTRGQLDAALQYWRDALALVPDDVDLKARIKRAETFQANYQSLSQQ